MKTFLLFAILLTVTLSGISQSWNMIFSGDYMRSISFPDASTGYIVGENGKIFKTIDASNNWTEQISNTPNTLNSVCFTNANIGYVAGYKKIILKTIDGGQTWVTQTSSSSGSFNSIVFPSASVGYTVGDWGVIYKTNDNGVTWNSQTSGTTKILFSVYFIDVNNGYAVGETGTILKTTNGGGTWAPQTSGTTQNLRSVFFVSSSTGWAVGGNGLILKTVNSGVNWYQQTSGFGSIVHSVYFTSPTVGYVLGWMGVLKTIDAGVTWTNQSIYTPSSSTTGTSGSFFFTNSNTGYIVCGNALLKTTNSGTNWNDNGLLYTYNSVAFADSSIGYCVGEYGMIRKTINGGNSWTKLSTTNTNVLNHICCTGPGICYTVGTNGTILKTINSGTTWLPQTSGTTVSLNSAYFLNSTTGYIVGSDGKILKTTNGSTWTPQVSGVTNYLLSVFFIDANIGYISGSFGKILKTTNGGTTWNVLNSGVTQDIENIFFIAQDTGYASQKVNGGIVLKTTNGGSTWIIQTNGGLGAPEGLVFTDASIGYLVGSGGAIHRTLNNGVTWVDMVSGATKDLNSVFFINSTKGWSIGDYGTFVKFHCNTLPSPAQGISGDNTICQGQSYVIYTTPVISNADSYVWSLPSGATGGGSTNIITVNYGTSAVSGNITVSGHNSCGSGASSSLAIVVSPLPANAGTITGPTTVCQGQNSVTYTVPVIANATSYIWSLPVGATGNSSTNSIIVNYGSTALSGNITVKGHDSCGDGGLSTLAVTVNSIPLNAGPISGPATVCQGQNSVVYTVPVIANATSYIWTLPTGATGNSSTNSITVSYGSSAVSGNISVYGHSSCGDGGVSVLAITVNPLPANAGAISGPSTVCQGQNSVNYSVPVIANATLYIWTLPVGASGSSSTNSILVNFSLSAVSGSVTVKGNNTCGDGAISTLPITVHAKPATPVITFDGTVLHSNVSNGNQWYNQNGLINGATGQNYTPVINGDYYVIVTTNGCSSDPSNSINVVTIGIEQIDLNRSIKIYPNPATDEIIFELAGNKGILDFEIFNSIGQFVSQGHLLEKISVQTTNFNPGVYLIRFKNVGFVGFKTFIKE